MKVYTQGIYDLFHYGHVSFLARCRKLGSVHVALLSDRAAEVYRGKKPIMSFKERLMALERCKYVNTVSKSNNKKTREEIISSGADIVAIGTDWAKKDIYKQYNIDDKSWLDEKLIYIPYTKGISTTDIKKRINDRF